MSLERRRETHDFVRAQTIAGADTLYRRRAFRDGSRLVEYNRVHLARALQYLPALDQQTQLGASPRGNHHRRWNGKTHRARTRNNENGNGSGDGARQGRHVSEQIPGEKSRDRYCNHRRDKHRADFVRQALDRRPRRLCVPHQFDDPRQHASGADTGCLVAEGTGGVESASHYGIAGGLGNRKRLACQHRLVDVAGAVDHGSIDWDALTGPHEHDIARVNLPKWPVDPGASLLDARRRWQQRGELSQGCRGLAASACFDRASRQHQPDDEDDRLVVDVGRDPVSRKQVWSDGRRDGVDKSGSRTESDEGVHVGGSVSHRSPRT